MSYAEVKGGDLAAVVTHLEMRESPEAEVPSSPLSLRRVEHPNPEDYRMLFRKVGARWLWFSRLIMDDAKLSAIIDHTDVDLFTVIARDGRDVGMLELDFRTSGECELSFVGLIPELAGQGHGRWLLPRHRHTGGAA